MYRDVLLLNADCSVLAYVPWQRAVTLLVTSDKAGVPLASVFEADPHVVIHSPSVSVPLPRIVMLSRYLHTPYVPKQHREAARATREGVLKRDRHACAYCGERATTIDHVFPQSRGGRDTWENLVAACLACNGRKADRTPEEAGMRLLWEPWCPDPFGQAQRQVWAALEAQAGISSSPLESV